MLANRRDRSGPRAFPLPPPGREDGATQVGTRVRVSRELPVTTNRELPILPPETAPVDRLDASDLDDRTVVDPHSPFDATRPAERIEFADALDDVSFEDEMGDTSVSVQAKGRLPLPPPSTDTSVSRVTMPGSSIRRRAAGKGRRTPPRPAGPPPSPAARRQPRETDDQAT